MKKIKEEENTYDDIPIEEMIDEIIKYKKQIGIKETKEKLLSLTEHEIKSQYQHYYNLSDFPKKTPTFRWGMNWNLTND